MFSSNRGQQLAFGIAAGSVLLLAVACVLTWLLATSQAKYAYQADQAAKQHEASAYNQISEECLYRPLPGFVKCTEHIIKANNESQATQYDLAAQQQMALWAMAMFWATCVSVLVTVIGIGFVWQTLRANRDAVTEAKNANIITRNAARDSVDAAKQTLFDSERAYISVDSVELEWTGQVHPRLWITVENFGNTPARWWGYKYRFVDAQEPAADFDASLHADCALIKWFGIPPKTTRNFVIHGQDIDAASNTAYKSGKRLRIDGEIQYETFFKERFVSEFSFSGMVAKQQTGLEIGSNKLRDVSNIKLSQTTQPQRMFFHLNPDGTPHHRDD